MATESITLALISAASVLLCVVAWLTTRNLRRSLKLLASELMSDESSSGLSLPCWTPSPVRELALAIRRRNEALAALVARTHERAELLEARLKRSDEMNDRLVDSAAQVVACLHELESDNAKLLDANRRLEKLALTDPLTGLGNRRAFQERLRRAVEAFSKSGRPMALLMMDVDRFKRLNDRYGHSEGDSVLRRVASSLKANLRSGDFLARLGGDEFAALLVDADLPTAIRISERVLEASREQTDPVPYTLSIGIAESFPGCTADQLTAYADEALYEAKRKGRSQMHTYDGSAA